VANDAEARNEQVGLMHLGLDERTQDRATSRWTCGERRIWELLSWQENTDRSGIGGRMAVIATAIQEETLHESIANTGTTQRSMSTWPSSTRRWRRQGSGRVENGGLRSDLYRQSSCRQRAWTAETPASHHQITTSKRPPSCPIPSRASASP
jgi:hypothetical protein